MIKKELVAISLIFFAFATGMVLTAVTSGCDSRNSVSAQLPSPRQ